MKSRHSLPNPDYWEDRSKDFWKRLERSEKSLQRRLYRFYDRQANELGREIQAYYTKYGKDNVIEYAELFQSLDDSDRRLLFEDMTEFTNKYPQYSHLVPIRESVYKLNRLQGLDLSVQLKLLEMGAIEEKELTNHLKNQVQGIYGETSQLLQGGLFNMMDDAAAEKLVSRNWTQSGNYSDSIWQNKARLMQYLHREFTDGFIRGDTYEELGKRLKDKFKDRSKYEIDRLIRTEGTFAANEAMMSAFEDSDYGEYEFVSVEDSKVCSICGGLENQPFKIEDRMPGLNFPPMHPHCRCTFTIVIPDEWEGWTKEEIEALANEPGWTQEEVDEILEKNGFISQDRRNSRISYSGSSQTFTRHNKDMKVKRVKGTKNQNIYVSDRLKSKKKAIRYYDNQFSEAYNLIGDIASQFEKPKIIIGDKSEFSTGVLASYKPGDNTLFVRGDITSNAGMLDVQDNTLVMNGNPLSTIIHELGHWYQYQQIKANNPDFTHEEILSREMANSKRLVEKLTKNKYNLNKDVSKYASTSFVYGKYYEVYAEVFVKCILSNEDLLEYLEEGER